MRLLFVVMLAITIMPMAPLSKAAAEEGDQMAYMVTYLEVTPAAKGQAATLLKQLAAASKQDAGLIRIEMLQRTTPSNQFVILEAWKDQAALDAHAAATHAKQLREKLTPLLIAPIDDRLSIGLLTAPPQSARAGLYVVTHVDVTPPNRDKAVAALNALAGPSRKEAGNVRFDVLQQTARSNHFTVAEAWKDQTSNDTHEIAAHTKEFRAALGPLAGALYDHRSYKPL